MKTNENQPLRNDRNPVAARKPRLQVAEPKKNFFKKGLELGKWEFPFEKSNLIILAIGIGIVIIGFLFLSTGINSDAAVVEGGKWNNPMAITVGPILLLIGFCVVIPYGIVKYSGNKKKNTEAK